MSTESPPTNPVQQALTQLTAEKALITNISQLCTDLTAHFSSLSQSLAARSQSLESSLQTLDSDAEQSRDSLNHRDLSIPERELAAAAIIEDRKTSAITDMEDTDPHTPKDMPAFLRLYCRRMDSAGLWRLVVSRRKDPLSFRKEIADAVSGAVDPPRLVLDSVADFLNHQAGEGEAPAAGGGDRYWGPRMLLWALFDAEGKKAQEVSSGIRERAVVVAEMLKGMVDEEEGDGGVGGGPNGQMFLQMVVAFGLSEKFEPEFLRKLILEHAWRKEMPKLAVSLGFGEKMPDIINELINMGKGIEAVYFAHESGFIEQFPPIPLIKSHLQSSKKSAQNILKNGKHSADAVDESCNVESGALRSIIKCVETLNLEKKFSLYSIRRRLSELEREKADRRKSAAANRMNKRQRSIGFGPNFHPAKAGRSGDASYASFHRNSPTAHQIPSVRHSYNPASSSLGATHTRSPIVLPGQYYATEDILGPRGSVPYAGPSAGYSGYDYTAPRTSLAQPAYQYHQ